MKQILLSNVILCFLFYMLSLNILFAEENFLLKNGSTNETVLEIGPHLNKPMTPCSTFKIALSLMGFDAEILIDENRPLWDYKEGYADYLESWREPQTPQSWIKNSCVWYSQLLTTELGLENVLHYLEILDYGNQNMSGGLTSAWLSSSLKISPKEQVEFIKNMIYRNLPISNYAIDKTKTLLYIEELKNGWKLFGKTGLGYATNAEGTKGKIGWFVGWVEKDQTFYPFAYAICAKQVDPSQRVVRVKEFLEEANIFLAPIR